MLCRSYSFNSTSGVDSFPPGSFSEQIIYDGRFIQRCILYRHPEEKSRPGTRNGVGCPVGWANKQGAEEEAM